VRTSICSGRLLRTSLRVYLRLCFSLQIFVIPSEDAIQAVHEMLFFMEAVRLAWVEHQFRIDSIAFEATVKLEALADRVDGVGFALQNQGGSLGVL
jgi:hypothetical protein